MTQLRSAGVFTVVSKRMTTIQHIEEWLAFVGHCPLEFSIQYPPRPEFFIENYSVDPASKAPIPDCVPELLYIHIPFCRRRCSYCFFATDHRNEPLLMDSYVQAVLDELGSNPNLQLSKVRCIDIGGGTPTALSTETLNKLLSKLSKVGACRSDVSRSIESTPQELYESPDKAAIIKAAGFNRLSMGIQTSSPLVLQLAKRKQEWQHVLRAYEIARTAGIGRINVDLIFGLPGQTLEHWRDDLNRVLEFVPDSITIYDCLYRGDRELISDKQKVPTLELMQKMYNTAYSFLISNNYHGEYGTVNFSIWQDEYGTSEYFERRLLWGDSYVGLGNYATSLLGDHWLFNFRSVDRYIQSIRDEKSASAYHYVLPESEQYAKYLLYSLNYGVILPSQFCKLFDRTIDSVFGSELSFAEKKGWIVRAPGRILVAQDMFASIYFLRSLFYSPAAKQWFHAWIGGASKYGH